MDASPSTPETGSTAAETTHRLPRVSLLFLIFGNVRQVIVPLAATLVAAPGLFAVWTATLLIPATLAAVARYVTFRYVVRGDELVVRHGLVTRTERNIPFGRIQNLDLVENPLHRLFGVAEVRLETASGGKPEAVIKVLGHDQIEDLRRHLDLEDDGDTADAGSGEATGGEATRRPVLVSQSLGDLVKLGLVSNRGMLVVAAAAGLLQQLGFFDDPRRFAWLETWLPAFFGSVDPETWAVASWGLGRWLLTGVLAVTALVLVTRLLSVAWSVATLYGFRLERRGQDFSAAYGLLTRVTATLPRRRLQLLSIHRPLLGQPWGLESLKVETAGGGASGDQQGPGAARLWLAPLVDAEASKSLVREAMPAVDPDTVHWHPLDPRAPRRLARRDGVLALVLSAPVLVFLTLFAGPVALLGLVAVPLASWRGWRFARRSGWGFATSGEEGEERRAIFFRSGAFEQRESLVPLGKIQGVALRETPFDRRWGMASLRVDTAGASAGGHRVDIPYLERELAEEVAEGLAERAAATTFLW